VAPATSAALAAAASAVPVAASATTLKGLLGNAVPADWEPHRTRPADSASPIAARPSGDGAGAALGTFTPLRDAATAARAGDRPTLHRPEQTDGGAGRLRSVLAARPPTSDGAERPAHPLRTLLTDPPAVPVAPAPADPPPADPLPAPPPLPAAPAAPEAPTVSGTVVTVKGLLPLG
jgi:hypothetical protein